MKGINKTILVGNVGKDPEVATLDGGVKVAKFSLATTDIFKDDKGQSHSHTEWHSIVLWRSLADLAEKYIRKGSLLYIEGKNRTRSYDDKQGIKRYVTEIVGEEVVFLDKKEG